LKNIPNGILNEYLIIALARDLRGSGPGDRFFNKKGGSFCHEKIR
jgi:hypothetical protein